MPLISTTTRITINPGLHTIQGAGSHKAYLAIKKGWRAHDLPLLVGMGSNPTKMFNQEPDTAQNVDSSLLRAYARAFDELADDLDRGAEVGPSD